MASRKLIPPKKGTKDVRPTSDRARETLFAILGDISDLSVLDLFAGSGALAIEALSRDADSAVLVDKAPALANRNIAELGLERRCEVIRGDAIRYLERAVERKERFGLVLCDPPYRLADPLEPELAQLLPPLLPRFGRLVVESSARRPLAIDLPLTAEREIGEALIRIYSK